MFNTKTLLLDAFWQSAWFNISLLIVTNGIVLMLLFLYAFMHKKKLLKAEAAQLHCSEMLQYANNNQQQLEAALQESKEYNKLFKATASSELRNGLNSIMSLMTLMRETSLTEEQKEYVEKVNNACVALLERKEYIFKSTTAADLMINRQQQKVTQITKKYEPKKLNADFAKQYPLQILIAEDDELNAQLMMKILIRLGYNADAVSNGQEALEILNETNYDLIFMDVNMQNMDGLEATRMIRLCLETQPVIIALTGSAFSSDKDKCLKAGMDDYLAKPVNMEELVATLSKWAVEKDTVVRETVGYQF